MTRRDAIINFILAYLNSSLFILISFCILKDCKTLLLRFALLRGSIGLFPKVDYVIRRTRYRMTIFVIMTQRKVKTPFEFCLKSK